MKEATIKAGEIVVRKKSGRMGQEKNTWWRNEEVQDAIKVKKKAFKE